MVITKTLNIISKFKRPLVSGRSYIAELDGLRFVAIAWVVFGHLHYIGNYQFPSWIVPFLNRPSLGVELFFVISGFVICQPFLNSKPDLKDYYFRRIRRIEPPFLICITLLLLSQCLRGIFSLELDGFLHALATFTYTHGLFYRDMSPINSVTWSLEVEVVFYLMAPFVVRAFLNIRKPWMRSASLLVTGLLLAIIAQPFRDYFLVYKGLLGNACFFFAGIAIAAMPKTRRTYYWDIVSLCGLMLVTWIILNSVNFIILNTIGWFGLCVGTLKGRVFKMLLSLPPFPIIGGMCYTIYLFHFPIIRQLIKLPYLRDTSSLLSFTVVAILSFGCCACLYFIIERPFMRRPRSVN